MVAVRRVRSSGFFALAALMSISASAATGCGDARSDNAAASDGDAITDVPQTTVERQSIGNCWIYAEASWAESMHLTATGESFDISQTYWTYWHWYDQLVRSTPKEISTGGFKATADQIARDRGVVAEADFVAQDALVTDSMSSAQSSALATINAKLTQGTLLQPRTIVDENGVTRTVTDRATLVRLALDEAFGLKAEVVSFLDKTFGKDGKKRLTSATTTAVAPIIPASQFKVTYKNNGADVATTLDRATTAWREVSYRNSWSAAERDKLLTRVQRALHDRQPVVITWAVDFNAQDPIPATSPVPGKRSRGSFNLSKLEQSGPGSQGFHMTVLEDYEAVLADGTVLAAGKTLDPSNPDEAALLTRALDPSTDVRFLRTKNSWGAMRNDRASVQDFPGYHDLYLDYLNGPIDWCSTGQTSPNCTSSIMPLGEFTLPPGY